MTVTPRFLVILLLAVFLLSAAGGYLGVQYAQHQYEQIPTPAYAAPVYQPAAPAQQQARPDEVCRQMGGTWEGLLINGTCYFPTPIPPPRFP